MNPFKIVLLCIFWVTLEDFAFSAKIKCKSDNFENCISELLMVGHETFKFPTNIKQMNGRCKTVKRLNVCINDFISECLTGETKNTVKLILYGVTKANRAYCSSISRKESFHRFGKCANRNLKALTQTSVDLNRRLHGILQYNDPKMRIPMVCCAYTVFKPAALEALKGCSEDEVNGFEHLIDSYAADGLSLVCSGYTAEESDVCNSVLKKIPKWNKPFNRKAFFYTVVDILNSL